MSAGNLHPIELYVVCWDLAGIPAGVYHFAPLEFGLTMLRSGDFRAVLAQAADAPQVADAPCTIVLTGIPWRTAWKYGERGYRHLYWDAGTLLANLLAIADGQGLGAHVLLGFADDEVSRLVGVDGIREFSLALAVVGNSEGPAALSDHAAVAPLQIAVAPLSANPITFPLITMTQQGGVLDDFQDIRIWRAAASKAAHTTVQTIEFPGIASRLSIGEVILRRGSTRLMRHEEAPRELLVWGMAVASRPASGDFAPDGTSLLQHYLSVHAITGLEPGAYRWRAGNLELLRAGAFRSMARRLCLNQSLGGDSAYTSFHCASLNEVLAALGSRGYRAAQLEAGIAAGRLSLAAFTHGYGATGLTFFDDEVSAFFETPAAPMLVTSVGIPDYRNTRGGLPGATPELAGFGHLMEKLRERLNASAPQSRRP
jgi:SagB-type dehydrogenase family enzyme